MARRKKRQRSSDDRAAQLRRRRQASNENIERPSFDAGPSRSPGPSRTGVQEDRAAQLRGQLSQGNKSAERMAQRALMGEMQNRTELEGRGDVSRPTTATLEQFKEEARRRSRQAGPNLSRQRGGREPSRRHLMQTQGPESLGARGQRDLPDHIRGTLESVNAARAGVPQDARRLTNEQRAGLSAHRDRLAEGEREKQRVESIRKANPGMVAREKEFQARGEALNADIGRQTQGMSPQDRDSFLKTYQPLKDMQADSARFSAEREKLYGGGEPSPARPVPGQQSARPVQTPPQAPAARPVQTPKPTPRPVMNQTPKSPGRPVVPQKKPSPGRPVMNQTPKSTGARPPISQAPQAPAGRPVIPQKKPSPPRPVVPQTPQSTGPRPVPGQQPGRPVPGHAQPPAPGRPVPGHAQPPAPERPVIPQTSPAPEQTDVMGESLRREREDRERRLEESRAARAERERGSQQELFAPQPAPRPVVDQTPAPRPVIDQTPAQAPAPRPVIDQTPADPVGKEAAGGFDPEARLGGPEEQDATEIREAKTYDFTTPEIKTEFGKQQVAAREGALRSAIEQRLLADIAGEGGDPETMAMRAEFESNRAKEQRQMVENLQRFGVIGGQGASAGASADVMGEFAGQTNLGRLRLDALAQQAGGRALERAMRYQAGQEDIGLREGQLTGNLRGTATLDAARLGATTGLAVGDQGLRRQESEAQLGLAGRRVDLEQAQIEEGLKRSRQEREEGRALFGERVGERERFDVEQDVARRGADVREDALAEQIAARQEAGDIRREEMLGRVGDQTTIARDALAEQAAERKARQDLEEAQVFGGEAGPGGVVRQTMAERALAEERRAARTRERLAETELMGETVEGGETFAAKEARERRALAEAELFGEGIVPGSGGIRRDTMAQKALTSEEEREQARMDLAQAELIGDVDGTETVASRALREQERQAQRREDLAAAELYGGDPRVTGQAETIAARALREETAARQGREKLMEEELYGASLDDPTRQTVAKQALTEEERQAQRREDLAELELFGEEEGVPGGKPGRKTVSKQALEEEVAARGERMDLAKGELVGQIDGEDTVATKALEQDRLDSLRREKLTREEMYGGRMGPGNIKEETQAAKEARQRHALMEGELLGEYGDDRTLQKEALEAELTGRYGGDLTVGEQRTRDQSDIDIAGRMLAISEARSKGANVDGLSAMLRQYIDDPAALEAMGFMRWENPETGELEVLPTENIRDVAEGITGSGTRRRGRGGR